MSTTLPKEVITNALLNLAYRLITEPSAVEQEQQSRIAEFIRGYEDLINIVWPEKAATVEPAPEIKRTLRLENVIVSGVMKEAELGGDEDEPEGVVITGYEIEHYSNITLQKLLFRYLERYNGTCPELVAALQDFEVGTNIAVKLGNYAKGYLVVEELRFDK